MPSKTGSVGVRYPEHASFVTTKEQKREIETIAATHGLYQGEVIRELLQRGLESYYNDRGRWRTSVR